MIYQESRDIAASAEAVYDTIATLSQYQAWNPWIRAAWGDITPGGNVTVKAQMSGRRMIFRHSMIAAHRPTRFHWRDEGWFTLFVYGERERTITPLDNNRCRYHVELRVTGLGSLLAKWLFGTAMSDGLKAEADALKSHCETLPHHDT